VEVVASLSQGRTAAAQCGLFTHKSVPVIFEPPCISLTQFMIFYLAGQPPVGHGLLFHEVSSSHKTTHHNL